METDEFRSLAARLAILEAEAAVRRLQARYMFLCDTPVPEFGVDGDAERIDRIMALYTQDAVWEGVGEYYDNQLGRAVGQTEIRAHFERFWGERRDPELLLNVHYLTSEQIHVHEGASTADGQWIHFQPWVFSDGTGLIRGSRLNNLFRKVDGEWRIQRTRTENVFVADLPSGVIANLPSSSVLMLP